jgi:hypothetical protein
MKVRQLMSRNAETIGPSDSCLEEVPPTYGARVRKLVGSTVIEMNTRRSAW